MKRLFAWAFVLVIAATSCAAQKARLIREWRLDKPVSSARQIVSRGMLFSGDALVVFQLERSLEPKLRARNQESSFTLVARVFSLNDGREVMQREILAPGSLDQLFLLRGERILARLDRHVVVLSPEFKPVFVREFASPAKRAGILTLKVSPDGRSFYIFASDKPKPVKLEQFDAESLQQMRTIILQNSPAPATISNKAMAFVGASKGMRKILLQRGSVAELQEIHHEEAGRCEPQVRFLSETELVLVGCNTLRFISTEGDPESTVEVPGSTLPTGVLLSQNGQRVLISGVRVVSSNFAGRAFSRRITVYDRIQHRFIADIEYLSSKNPEEPAFSLDGERFAILDGDNLKAYSLAKP